ncbi:hypothetical protein ACFVAJ_08110 [Agromyces sp. NPDC057679]|uniref:hypothetical protein n=1 Tax=Agromyces sp. NPDC057679 TaxID=3346207 RepID=UPI00366C7150
MTLRILPRALTAATGLALLLLSGCAATPAEPTANESSPSAEAEPSAEATPAAPDAGAEPSCDTVFTEEENAELAADGLTLNTESPFPLGQVMVDLTADGALDCQWSKDQSDVAVWFSRLAEDDAAWAARSTEIGAAGWTVSDDPITGTMLAPADYDANYQPSIVHVDGVTYFVSYADLLDSVAELQ